MSINPVSGATQAVALSSLQNTIPTAAAPAAGTAVTQTSSSPQSANIAALTALVKDTTASQELAALDGSSGASAGVLTSLTAAFQQLIGSLAGTTTTAGTAASTTAAATATSSTTAASIAAAAAAAGVTPTTSAPTTTAGATPAIGSTAAIEAFLNTSLQDLQSTSATSTSPLGSILNTTA